MSKTLSVGKYGYQFDWELRFTDHNWYEAVLYIYHMTCTILIFKGWSRYIRHGRGREQALIDLRKQVLPVYVRTKLPGKP